MAKHTKEAEQNIEIEEESHTIIPAKKKNRKKEKFGRKRKRNHFLWDGRCHIHQYKGGVC
jgi:hypothetical protein